MPDANEKLITRGWYFTFWSPMANVALGVGGSVKTATGYPSTEDIQEATERVQESLKEHSTSRKDFAHGTVCTGWFPLDDEVE